MTDVEIIMNLAVGVASFYVRNLASLHQRCTLAAMIAGTLTVDAFDALAPRALVMITEGSI